MQQEGFAPMDRKKRHLAQGGVNHECKPQIIRKWVAPVQQNEFRLQNW
jgi:hypothetical protein